MKTAIVCVLALTGVVACSRPHGSSPQPDVVSCSEESQTLFSSLLTQKPLGKEALLESAEQCETLKGILGEKTCVGKLDGTSEEKNLSYEIVKSACEDTGRKLADILAEEEAKRIADEKLRQENETPLAADLLLDFTVKNEKVMNLVLTSAPSFDISSGNTYYSPYSIQSGRLFFYETVKKRKRLVEWPSGQQVVEDRTQAKCAVTEESSSGFRHMLIGLMEGTVIRFRVQMWSWQTTEFTLVSTDISPKFGNEREITHIEIKCMSQTPVTWQFQNLKEIFGSLMGEFILAEP